MLSPHVLYILLEMINLMAQIHFYFRGKTAREGLRNGSE